MLQKCRNFTMHIIIVVIVNIIIIINFIIIIINFIIIIINSLFFVDKLTKYK